MTHTCERKKREAGYVLLTSAVLALVLIAFTGLVADVGTMRYWKRRAQNAADAAAVGALMEVNRNGSGADFNNAGLNEAQALGMTNGTNGVSVKINHPPSSGPYTNIPRFAEAEVTKQVPLAFLRVLNRDFGTVTARAVAGARSGDACVIALRPDGDARFEAAGSSIFRNACGIYVNATGPSAMKIGNTASISATSINVVGGISGTNYTTTTGPPLTGAAPIQDPFLDLPAPAAGGCTYTNFSSNTNQTMYPGVYCGGITLNGGTLTMAPGMYVIKGGGIKENAGTTLQGTGVTIYNTGAPGYSYTPIVLNGNSTTILSAPTSGTYAGILFFTDRSITSPGVSKFLGTNFSKIEGTIYMPSVPVELTGTSDMAAYTIIVAWTIKITGNGEIHNDYSSLDSGTPIKSKGAMTVE